MSRIALCTALAGLLLASPALADEPSSFFGALTRRWRSDPAPAPIPAPAEAAPRSTWSGLQRLGVAPPSLLEGAATNWPVAECSFSAAAGAAASCSGRPAAKPASASEPAAAIEDAPPDRAPLRAPAPVIGRLHAASSSASSLRATLLPLAVIQQDRPVAQDIVAQPPAARHPIPQPRLNPPIQPAASGPANTMAPLGTVLTLEAGMGRVIQLRGNTSSVFAADPKVAEVRPASTTSLFVFGVAPGRTTIAALDATGQPIAQYDVLVQPTGYAAAAAHAGIARALPGRDLHVDTLGNGLAVTGQVGNAAEAERAMLIARGFAPTGQSVVNHLGMNSSIQVNLRVRIVEMSRSLTRDIGVNWSALSNIGKYTTFAGATATVLANLTSTPGTLSLTNRTGINAVIDALAQDQLVHLLAEPNLTAMSGETASFLVGGEFPIPVAQQNNQTTIEFKQYGVSLAFVPTVISDGHISLKVRPEVSQLTTQGAVQLSAGNSTIQVPALTVRRAETTVELGSGQSFAIAGLLQDSATIADSAIPFLGELPILGPLFRSDAFQRNETELVIIVTPYIVRPASNPDSLITPISGYPVPNDNQRLLQLRQVGRPAPLPQSGEPRAASLPSSAGFIVQ